jgi:hypothetical protein
MSYKINPVKASLDKGYIGIHSFNNACYGVCNAFNDSSNGCHNQCASFINQLRKNTYGTGYCGHHAPNLPVLWNQIPRFFPKIYNNSYNMSTALQTCKEKCKNTKLPQECNDMCELDAGAVEEYKIPPVREAPIDENDFEKYENDNPIPFWIGAGIAVLIFTIFFIFFIKIIR